MRLPLFILFLLGYSLTATAQLTVKLYEDKSYINKLEQQYAKSGYDSIKASSLCSIQKHLSNVESHR
ncbi:hypothetical protein EV200_104310 [Pedobacter psychrotolerans]|uniref:Uncharacterized protein n=1 Tax=Pedobacter psychrotolerans TaxID=1843235 RepID=A0A4R2HE93_9SPHI|nr:hypothetical protein EV200_104310 [Pedobacter psychrotolerans]GGE46802.1 hypothetical protein GCM10011413_11100 [Pedobacter psychrotolerans]